MSDPRLTQGSDPPPEVRLELTNAEGHQVWALYSDRPQAVEAPESPFARFVGQLPSIAWRWRRRVALGAAAGAVLGLLYLLVATPIYVVSALVHIEQRDSVLQQYEALRSGSTFIATQSEVIHSPRIVGAAFDAVGLPENPKPGLLSGAKGWIRSFLPSSNGSEPPDPRGAALLTALSALGASPVVGTDVMSITFRTADPEAGVTFLDALIARYREYVQGLESEAHGEGLTLLRDQERELRGELQSLQARYDQVHAQTLALGRDDNALSVQRMRLEEHARAHVEARGRRIELQNRVAQLADGLSASPARRSQLIEELRAEEASAAQLAEFQRELRAARRTEQTLAALYEKEWAAAKDLEKRRAEEEQIRGEIERVSAERDSVLALLREKELRVLSLSSGHAGTVVRVLEPPSVPGDPVWPQPALALGMFGFVGALGGFALAVLAELRLRAARVWS